MSYGQEVRFDNLGIGLVNQYGETELPPGAALVERNFSFDELGALRKRNGFTRSIREKYVGQVRSIVPIENCVGRRQYIVVAADDIRLAPL